MPPEQLTNLFHQVKKKLLSANRAFYLLKAGTAALWFLFGCLALLLAYTLTGMLVEFPVALRFSFWVLSALALGYVGYRYLLPMLRKAFRPAENDLYDTSRKIGRENVSVSDALVNFLQIYSDRESSSPDPFKNRSLAQLHDKIDGSDFSSILSTDELLRPLARLGMLLTAFLLLFMAFPSSISRSMLKVLQPTKNFEMTLPVTLVNQSGDKSVLKNEPVQLGGSYEGLRPAKLWAVVETLHADADSMSQERMEIPAQAGNRFSYEMNFVRSNFRYWFEGQVDVAAFRNRMAVSDTAEIEVKERPHIRELQAKLSFPAYTRQEDELLAPNDGEVTALVGTQVAIEVTANKSLGKAWLEFSDSARLPLTIRSNQATAEFTVREDVQYQIRIEDQEAISNYQPVSYAVFALRDEAPYVEISEPGKDLDLGDEIDVPILVNLRDDYGFSRLTLNGRHVRAGSAGDTANFSVKLPLQRLDRNRAISDYKWNLYDFYLIPDDYIEYYAEVRDNDRITGPKSARSKTFIIRLPSVLDVFDEAEEVLSEKLDETDEVRKDTEELKEKLEEINREMLKEDELSWERKQEIQEQLDQQKESFEKLDEIQQELSEMVEKMDQNDMLSPETLEKYMEVQKMFEELATPELLEAMKQIEEAMQNQDMEQMKQAMEQFEFSVDEFESRVERTFEIFKKIQQEQKMDELVKQAESLLEEQKEINEQLSKEDVDKAQQEQLARKEEALKENAENLSEKLEQTSEEFKQDMADISEKLQEAGEFMEQQQVPQQMEQMQQQMQQGDMKQAKEKGKDVQKNLEMLQSKMQQSQQEMNQQEKQQIMQAMQKIQQDLLNTSFQQEKLAQRSQNADMASESITDIARNQSQQRENLNNVVKELIDLSKETFFISPDMSKLISSMMENMDNALKSLENRNTRSAGRSQMKAMGDVNQAIMSMQGSMQQLSQSGSGTGFEQFMQQMQQMAGQQGQLNQQSMSMFQKQGQGQKPSPDAMGRMAAQQGMIKKSLESLNQKMGRQGDVLGRLGEMGKEMEKIIDQLNRQNVDQTVIQRQQRILSRMLDAQKSMREKEYSQKRQSQREDTKLAKSPPSIKRDLLERENKLRKEMLDALKEGYSAEYKEYIKAYYELLSRQPQAEN
ncbi:MAG: DUF4175 family protein [Calditrichia bacterium]